MSRNFIADREFRKIDEQIKREARENPDLRRRLQERKEKKENAKRIRMEILYSRKKRGGKSPPLFYFRANTVIVKL